MSNQIEIDKAEEWIELPQKPVPPMSEVIAYVRETGIVSCSHLQRHFGIDFNQAAKFVEALENEGIISSYNSEGKRTVL